ncbi:MAG: hypothetical protein K0R65_1332 [Crocinitomicaceae bacterium]|nr:hypothetical protein [Crocinitomicaceae bacterium]
MKKVQKLFVLTLIGLIFCGSVGVSVFAHLCSVDGLELSYFQPQEDKCKPAVEEKSCCHEEKPAVEHKKSGIDSDKCCKESVSYYKISTENADKILKLKLQPNHAKVFLLFPEIFPSIFVKEEQIAYEAPPPPGKSSGREILIAHQVFRI